ncbi:MAG: hypothetical protein MR832_10305 [Clostridiales bacterium]|nr:hypothetical protein [Clostridiales bacterium]
MATVREKCWMFGVRPHQDDIYLGKGEENRFTKWSRITPAEGAAMLGVPNMIMVNCDGVPAPYSYEARGYMESFCRMRRVLWSASGSEGRRTGIEERYVAELARTYPNLAGAFLDDFYGPFGRRPEGERSEAARRELEQIRAALDGAGRPLELWAVWYTLQESLFTREAFEPLTGVSMWTWDCRDLPALEESFARLERFLPDKKKMLGIYMFDFPSGEPVPEALMAHQCETGLRLLREGRVEGLIFEANSVMGVGLPSEYWLRRWLDRVGGTEL